MATLSISIGTLTASITTTDAKANALVTQYGASIGASGTNQQKLNQIVAALARHMQEQGRRHRREALKVDALAAAQAEMDALWWDVPEPPVLLQGRRGE